jgi:hypothetical protein
MQETDQWTPPDPRDEYVYIRRHPDGTIDRSVTICIPHELELAFAYEILGYMWSMTVPEARKFAAGLLQKGFHLDRRVSHKWVTLKPLPPELVPRHPVPPPHNRFNRKREPAGSLPRR